MSFRNRANRTLAGAVAAVTMAGTALISPSVEAWNPFGWVARTSGSMLNRVEHGVLGSTLLLGGAVAAVAGVTLTLVGVGAPVGIPLAIAGVAAATLGYSIMAGVNQNKNLGTEWAGFLHHPWSTGGSSVPRYGDSRGRGLGAGNGPGRPLGQPR